MNDFDKHMANVKAARRRKFWDDIWYWTVFGVTWLSTLAALIVIIWTILWWPW